MKEFSSFELLDITKESSELLMDLKPHTFFHHLKNNPEDNRVLALACMLHEGQKDKSGHDYIVHLIDTANRAIENKEKYGLKEESNSLIIQSALLHDSKEDEEAEVNRQKFQKTQEQLYIEYNIHERSQFAIDSVTRKEDESYKDFIERIKLDSKQEPLCKLTKISDIESNNNEIRMELTGMTIPDSLKKRYKKAKEVLSEENATPCKLKKKSNSLTLNM